jgi:hypothetical protein
MRASGPGQPALLLLDILDILENLGVPAAIVGALAVSYYGVPRSSIDADAAIWLQDSGKSAAEVQSALTRAGYKPQLRLGDIDDPIAAVLTTEDGFGNVADLLIGIRGMDPSAQLRCTESILLDSPVRIIGAEDLVAMKLFAGGPQDVLDAQGILKVWKERLDPQLLRKLAENYGTDVLQLLDTLTTE